MEAYKKIKEIRCALIGKFIEEFDTWSGSYIAFVIHAVKRHDSRYYEMISENGSRILIKQMDLYDLICMGKHVNHEVIDQCDVKTTFRLSTIVSK